MLKITFRRLDTEAVQIIARRREAEVSESVSSYIQREVAIEISLQRTPTKSANTDTLSTSATQPNALYALGFILLMLMALVVIGLIFAYIAQALELAKLISILIASLLVIGLLAQGALIAMGKVSGKDFTTTVSEFFKAIGLLNPRDPTEKADSEPEHYSPTERANIIGQNNIYLVQFRPAISVGGTPLANIHSAIKRNRSSKRRAARNQAARGKARSAVKDARSAIASGQDAAANVNAAASALDKAAEKGIIHKRNAARRKSRLMKAAAKAQQSGK